MGNPVSAKDIVGAVAAFVPVLSAITGTIQAFHYSSKVKNLDIQIKQQELQQTAGKVDGASVEVLKKQKEYCEKLFVASIVSTIPIVNVVAAIYSSVILSKLAKLEKNSAQPLLPKNQGKPQVGGPKHTRAAKVEAKAIEKTTPVKDSPKIEELKALRQKAENQIDAEWGKLKEEKASLGKLHDKFSEQYKNDPLADLICFTLLARQMSSERSHRDSITDDLPFLKQLDVEISNLAKREKEGTISKEDFRNTAQSIEKSLGRAATEYEPLNFKLTWKGVTGGKYNGIKMKAQGHFKELKNECRYRTEKPPLSDFDKIVWKDVKGDIDPTKYTEAQFNERMDFLRANMPK